MVKYYYEDYCISIYSAPPYTPGSSDNKPYCKIIALEQSDFCSMFEIEVEHWGEVQSVLLVAPYHTPTNSFTAYHKKGVFMMLNDVLCIFNPKTLSIGKQVSINPLGTMFEVHTYREDYILYGETDIYRISEDLDIMWEFSARDIFVRCQGDEPAFLLKDDRICLYDFLDNYYEIDYNGHLLTDRQAHT